jgi:oligoribonuclease NrnB/cAMP/cGMP phosphodiesterase (DHH superfamily)
MEYIVGSKENFWKFVDSITSEDKVAILSHTDLDGVGSAIFLEEILKERGIEVVYLNFRQYGTEVCDEESSLLKEKNITKLFISDMCLESADKEGFERLGKEFGVFLIDHHPITEQISNERNVLKTRSTTCAAAIMYDLAKDILDMTKWKELVCAIMVSEFSFNDPENLRFIQESYPDVTLKNVFESSVQEEANKLSYLLIYFRDDLLSVYDLVKKRDFGKIEEYYLIVKKEIDFWVGKFWKEAEFSPEKNLYFYYFNPGYHLTSVVATVVSLKYLERTFILASDASKKGKTKVSARNQAGVEDMSRLMKKGIDGLEQSTGGGHFKASAAGFLKKDLEKFKQNILNN